MIIVFDTKKLEQKRQSENLSMRKLSLMLSPREAFYRELVIIRGGEISSIYNACQLVSWFGSLDCIIYCRPQVLRILKKALVRGLDTLDFVSINKKMASGPDALASESSEPEKEVA